MPNGNHADQKNRRRNGDQCIAGSTYRNSHTYHFALECKFQLYPIDSKLAMVTCRCLEWRSTYTQRETLGLLKLTSQMLGESSIVMCNCTFRNHQLRQSQTLSRTMEWLPASACQAVIITHVWWTRYVWKHSKVCIVQLGGLHLSRTLVYGGPASFRSRQGGR